MAEAGWYLDDQDSAQARWYDGEAWTEDRVLMADHDGPPPPPEKRKPAFVAPPLPPSAPAPAAPVITAPPPIAAPPPPVASPPPVRRAATRQAAKADAKASAARAKALRPWFKKKRYILPLGIAVIAIIGSIASAGGNKDDNSPAASSATGGDGGTTVAADPSILFPGRPDAQHEDQERAIGSSALLSGYTATLNSATFVQSLSDFEDAGYIKLNVTIANRDKKSQPYNVLDWRLQFPGGTVKDLSFTTGNSLEYGDLVGGGSVTGDVVFEVGTERGAFFILYKPDAFDAARGIWSVNVP
jgi:hypothetical protein